MKKYNYILSGLVAALALGTYYLTTKFPKADVDVLGAGFWPRMICYLLFGLSVLLAVSTFCDSRAGVQVVTFFATDSQRMVWLVVAVVAVFFVLIRILGFLTAALIFLPVTYFILGERNILKVMLLNVGSVGFIYVVFCHLLNVRLPQGMLF